MINTLCREMDETFEALEVFDVERLEALERRIHALTAEQLARSWAQQAEMLPELMRKHATLEQMLRQTSANLKVLASVLQVTAGEVS